jgi:hypothetical protein
MGLCPYLKYIKIKRSNKTRTGATTKKRGEELEPKLMKQKKKQKGWKLLHNQKAAHSSGCAVSSIRHGVLRLPQSIACRSLRILSGSVRCMNSQISDPVVWPRQASPCRALSTLDSPVTSCGHSKPASRITVESEKAVPTRERKGAASRMAAVSICKASFFCFLFMRIQIYKYMYSILAEPTGYLLHKSISTNSPKLNPLNPHIGYTL